MARSRNGTEPRSIDTTASAAPSADTPYPRRSPRRRPCPLMYADSQRAPAAVPSTEAEFGTPAHPSPAASAVKRLATVVPLATASCIRATPAARASIDLVAVGDATRVAMATMIGNFLARLNAR